MAMLALIDGKTFVVGPSAPLMRRCMASPLRCDRTMATLNQARHETGVQRKKDTRANGRSQQFSGQA